MTRGLQRIHIIFPSGHLILVRINCHYISVSHSIGSGVDYRVGFGSSFVSYHSRKDNPCSNVEVFHEVLNEAWKLAEKYRFSDAMIEKPKRSKNLLGIDLEMLCSNDSSLEYCLMKTMTVIYLWRT